MPQQTGILRGRDFATNGGTTSFLDNLLLGENIRQAAKERSVLNELDAQQIQANKTAEERNRQVIAAAEQEAFKAAFEEDEALKNAISLGTVPFAADRQGQVTDVSKAIPSTREMGQPVSLLNAPEQTITAGDRTGQDYRGPLSVSQEEQNQRRGAFETQRKLTKQGKIDEEAGRIERDAIQQEQKLATAAYSDLLERKYQQEVVQPQELEKQRRLFEHQTKLENIRASVRRDLALTGRSGQIEELGIGTTNGSIPMSKVPQALVGDVLAWQRATGRTTVDPKKAEGLREIIGQSQNLLSNMERAAQTFNNEGEFSNFVKTGAFLMDTGLPFTDVRAEVGKMKQEAINLARTTTRDRVTDRDAFAFEVGSMPAPTDSPEIRQRKIEDAYISIGRGIKSSGLSDAQLVDVLGADVIPYIDAANNAAEDKRQADIEKAQNSQEPNFTPMAVQDPDIIRSLNETGSQAEDFDAEVKRQLEAMRNGK